MRKHFHRAGTVVALLGTFLIAGPALWAQGPGEPPPVPGYEPDAPGGARTPPPAAGDDVTVQPRGPVHEAFAQPVDVAPRPGPVVPKKPPAPIPEVAPDQRPEGDNVVWVPGYWGWDVGRKEFLWVSGVWRMAPPGRKWVPGYWNEADGGWQRVAGFWAAADQDAVPYLPTPPATLDNGPSAPPPDDDSFYVPGNWMYRDARYLWRPGYWMANRPGMLWNPASYLWTPSGCVFVDGYWDYPLDGRGLLFAPVSFNGTPWNTPGWAYQPNYCVGLPGLLSSLFAGPGGGYYFGDYYGAGYQRLGFRPWFNYGSRYYNPLLTYGLWQNRGNAGWYGGLTGAYRGRFAGTLARPPRTLIQQNRLFAGTTIRNLGTNVFSNRNSLQMVGPLNRAGSFGYRRRLTTLNAAQRNQVRNFSRGYAGASRFRQTAERARATRSARGSLSLARVPHGPSGNRPRAIPPAYLGRNVTPRTVNRVAPRVAAAPRANRPPVVRNTPRAVARPQHSAPAFRTPAFRPAPRAAPRAAFRPAPRPAPRAAFRPAPRPAFRPAPRPAPVAHRAAPASHPAPRPAPNHGGRRR